MSSNSTNEKVNQLENEIRILRAELEKTRLELNTYKVVVDRTNSQIENIISDINVESKTAAKIQKLLSPVEIPNIPGIEFSTKFVPGTKFGGDYFDIFELHDKLKFGILVSSCSGYAMSALFMSVLMKYTAQLEAKKGMDPAQVIELLAMEIAPQIQKNETASLFYGVVDRRNFSLHYSCIGKLGVILKDSDRNHSSWLEPSSGPLEKGYSGKPLTHVLSLNPRDQLVIVSEGILNAPSSDEVFGKERLISAVETQSHEGVHGIRNEILFQSENFTQQKEPIKDQTVIVTEIKDRVIKLANKGRI